jgi:mono/diheme cytochrome c family protein
MARRLLIVACLAIATPLLSGCGSQSVQVAKSDPHHTGAVLFAERCGACHTLSVVGTQGSATNVRDKENVDGPNFDTRVEKADDVEYAIENGGFSGAIMPENIVTGEQKKQVAAFLAKYAGKNVATRSPKAGSAQPGGADQPPN